MGYTQAELERMRNVVVGGWDSPESYYAALARGETIGVPPPQEWIVEPAASVPSTTVGLASKPVASYGTGVGGGLFGSLAPGSMINVIGDILGGVWSGFDPGDPGGGLAILHSYAESVYGSVDLGVLRRSSEVLENEPSGIRPGTMERIVIPAWARNQRGSPI